MPALLAMLAIMTFALMLAMPSWRYIVKDDKEQELIFRGRQISAAIAKFQRKNGNAFPTSFEQLVKGKFLRQAYKDPMTPSGDWRMLGPGEVVPGRPGSPGSSGAPGGPGRPTPTPTPAPTPVFGAGPGTRIGPIAGVASLSKETGLRMVNGNAAYNQWVFAPNVPFIVGGQPGIGAGGLSRAPNQAPPQGGGQRAPDVEAPRISR
ncbi:MAG: type II secretion system GspH family protein [Vicinamibacteria bacterium]|nr:type II secretion system GspH family protein [Vicinamibacteria bacterium]